MKSAAFTMSFVLLLILTLPCMAQTRTWFQGISETNINVRGSAVVVGQLDVDIPSSGYVEVHFDGICVADVGDRIVLAASDIPDWGPNDGNVSVEAVNTDINTIPFSHTRVYPVTAGSQSFYAVAQNYVEIDGSGIASIYASLTVRFFPDNPGSASVAFQGIDETGINVRGNPVAIGHITLNTSSAGKAVVHFDGMCVAAEKERIRHIQNEKNAGLAMPENWGFLKTLYEINCKNKTSTLLESRSYNIKDVLIGTHIATNPSPTHISPKTMMEELYKNICRKTENRENGKD